MKRVINILLTVALLINVFTPITNANPTTDDGVFLDYNFSTMTSLPTLTNGPEEADNGVTSAVTLKEVDGVKVLEWKRNHTTDNTYAKMELPLTRTITAADFPIEIEYSAKLDGVSSRWWGNFALAGTDSSNNTVKSLYGVTNWYSYAPFQLRFYEDKTTGAITNYSHWSNGTFTTAIRYGGELLDGSKYYVHRYVINADGTYAYQIKEDTADAVWENVHSDYKLRTLSNAYPVEAANAGKLPANITALYSQAGYYSCGDARKDTDLTTDKIDYIKYLKVSSCTLELEETNIPEGDNPKFGNKEIKFKFNMPVSDATLYDGIKLYKDSTEVTTGYTLSTDSNDKSLVYLKLEDYPAFGSSYQVIINDKLNKDIDGFAKAVKGYPITFNFYNAQGIELELKSSTPLNGEMYDRKKVTLDFSHSIDLQSAIENIKVYENETEFVHGTDYTLTLDENDGSVVYIELTEDTEYSTESQKVWYKVVIGADLNKGTYAGELFPADYEPKTIAFYKNHDCLNYDFTIMNEAPQHTITTTDESATSSLEIVRDNGVNVLKWQRNHTDAASVVEMVLPLPLPITQEDFPIKIEYSAKLDELTTRKWGNFALSGVDSSNNAMKSLYGVTKWYSYAPFQVRAMEKGSSLIGYGNYATQITYQDKAIDGSKYYVHSYVINADGTYTYQIKEDTAEAEWETVHSDYKLRTFSKEYPIEAANAGKLPANITSLYSQALYNNSNLGVIEADLTSDKIDYFKYLKITKQAVPVITSISMEDGATDVPVDLDEVNISFNVPVKTDVITKENISIYSVDGKKETKVDDALYTIVPNGDGTSLTIKFEEYLEMNKKYNIKIKGLVAYYTECAMPAEQSISFETAKDYYLNPTSVTKSQADNTLTLTGMLKSYEMMAGKPYVIMAALVDENEVFYDVVYEKFEVPAPETEGEVYSQKNFSLTFDNPDGGNFNPDNYWIKIYSFDDLEYSESILDMNAIWVRNFMN